MLERAVADIPPTVEPVRFVVRGGEQPGIAVVGDLTDLWVARIKALFEEIVDRLEHWNYVSFDVAAGECVILAERLEDRLGASALNEAVFAGVPRGGLIVLGMLSMVMGLRQDQLGSHRSAADLVVFIDDCALTGHRLKALIGESPAERLACGFLRAADELCAAVEARESRVEACLAVSRLRDVGPQMLGSGYAHWVERWNHIAEGHERYWIGVPERVAFAWKEPDRSFINTATGEREVGWHVMPRKMCLSTQALPTKHVVVLQEPGIGPLRPSPGLFWIESDGIVEVAQQGSGEAVKLDAVGSAIWTSIVQCGEIDGVVTNLREIFDAPETRLRDDVDVFVDQLLETGLLVRTEAPTSV